MELVLKQNPNMFMTGTVLCGLAGLALGPAHLLGFLSFGGAAVLGFQAIQASQGKLFLKVDPMGFTYTSMSRQKRVAWGDIESVGVVTYYYMGFIPIRRMVAYRYVPGKRGGAMRKAAGWFNGWDEMLPGTFGMKAKELGALLEAHRQRSGPSITPNQTIV